MEPVPRPERVPPPLLLIVIDWLAGLAPPWVAVNDRLGTERAIAGGGVTVICEVPDRPPAAAVTTAVALAVTAVTWADPPFATTLTAALLLLQLTLGVGEQFVALTVAVSVTNCPTVSVTPLGETATLCTAQ